MYIVGNESIKAYFSFIVLATRTMEYNIFLPSNTEARQFWILINLKSRKRRFLAFHLPHNLIIFRFFANTPLIYTLLP